MEVKVEKEYHLVRIFPEQVGTFWHLIREAIIESFTPIYEEVSEEQIASIQSEIMSGRIQAFGIVESTEDLKMVAIALTIISNEPILREKSLVIIGIKSFGYFTDSMWSQIGIGLVNIARAEGCTVASFVTKDEKLIKMAADFGMDVDIRFCFLRIGV